jgi:thiosulfate/3-mercaptopyruvate sulfurtransferase
LPDPKVFFAWLGRLGLSQSDQVVCYDSGPGTMAARLWWMLRWVRHPEVAVLDGGYAKWIAEQRPVSSEDTAFSGRSYEGKPDRSMAVDVAFVERNLKKSVLLDARAPARYCGEQEPIDPVAGRIPGALNRFNNDNLTAAGTFKPAEVLRQEFLAVLGDRPAAGAINYCGSGVSACHNLLAMEIAGLGGARLYAGSWSEWSSNPARPIARST